MSANDENAAAWLHSNLALLSVQWHKGTITPREYVSKVVDYTQQALREQDQIGQLATVDTALADPLSHELTFNVMGWQLRNIDSPFSTCISPTVAAVIATEISAKRAS
jgi:hypothetical protein